MDRRGFLRTAPAATMAGVAVTSGAPEPQGVHLSIDADSPFFGGVLATCGIKQVLFNGEPIKKCVEASEPDGFVIQNVHHRAGNTHLLREPGAIFIPATSDRPPRVKRFGVVRIEFREVPG